MDLVQSCVSSLEILSWTFAAPAFRYSLLSYRPFGIAELYRAFCIFKNCSFGSYNAYIVNAIVLMSPWNYSQKAAF